jgi:hypothetical protein
MSEARAPERRPVGIERRTRNAILIGTALMLVGIALAVMDDGWGR